MRRTLIAALLAAALPAALLSAPFAHVHESGEAEEHVAEHHSGGADLHIHFTATSQGKPAWTREADESALSLELFQADLSADDGVAFVSVVESAFEPPAPADESWVADEDYRTHDPPRIATRSPRAPPEQQ